MRSPVAYPPIGRHGAIGDRRTAALIASDGGAFLRCTFWLATARAMAGQIGRTERLLERAETLSGELGLFAEEVDPRTGQFLGNYPLLFSHVEHIRTVVALQKARSLAGATA